MSAGAQPTQEHRRGGAIVAPHARNMVAPAGSAARLATEVAMVEVCAEFGERRNAGEDAGPRFVLQQDGFTCKIFVPTSSPRLFAFAHPHKPAQPSPVLFQA